jgi:diguanylate cyclase (GGDEF)-like protein
MAAAIQARETDLRELAAGLEVTITERTAELRRQNEVLEKMAITDPLTKAFNRRYFFDLAEKEMERALRYHRPLAVAIIDTDYFKDVNDTYGHQAGDQALINLVQICQQNIRTVDLFARYGGEEFVILMPESSPEAAIITVERLRTAIKNTPQVIDGQTISLSISAGIACWDATHEMNVSALLAHADQGLYQSKQGGRDRVTLWQNPQ